MNPILRPPHPTPEAERAAAEFKAASEAIGRAFSSRPGATTPAHPPAARNASATAFGAAKACRAAAANAGPKEKPEWERLADAAWESGQRWAAEAEGRIQTG